jgi:hypothetical protein
LWYRKPVKVLELVNPAEPIDEFVYTPHMYQAHRQHDEYYTAEGIRYSSLADTFAFGSSEIIDKFCSVYPDFLKLHKILYPYVYGESYLGYQARHHHQLKIAVADIQYELMHRIMDMRSI